LDSNFKGRG